VIALGYILGLGAGPLVAVVGGLALITLGRAVIVERAEEALAGAALAVIALALSTGAVRWGTTGLTDVRGAQAVLGPTVLLEPTQSAAACWVAAGAGVIALGVWTLAGPRARGRPALAWAAIEVLIAALALTSVFWGPALVPAGAQDFAPVLGGWALAVIATALPATGLALLLPRIKRRWTMAAISVAALAATGALVAAAGRL
jgi:hypothetical protein